MSSDLIPAPMSRAQFVPSHDAAYRDGFQDGFAAADMSAAGFGLCGCGMVVLLLACGLLARHTSRLVSTLCRYLDRLGEDGFRYLKSCLLPLLVCIMLTGCAEKTQGDISNPAPIPPTVENAPAPADGNRDRNAFTPHDASYREDGSGQYLAVHTPVDTASGSRPGEPAELASLLEMKGEKSAGNTAVSRMRPNAIREAAQLVTFQTAIAWRYGQLVRQTERHSAVMDAAFNFSPLLLTQGDALIMPPLIARSGASMRIEDSMTATAAKPGVKDWQELVPESAYVLSGASVIGGKMLLTYDKDAANHAYVYTLDGRMEHEIRLPSLGSVGFSGDKDDKECFFTFTSFTIPGATYKYDIERNTYTLLRAPKVDFNADEYTTEQVFYPSKDGTKIPMFLTYRKDLKRNGQNPVYLYGYGGFNISLYPGFSSSRIPFLESGGIYAQVNLRGGAEYGEEWHLAGTKMQKQNVFDDFIAAAEWLVKNGYTGKDKIAIVGGSNGGLLVGACMTQRPDLFRVAIPQVGVMDMLRYHKFTIGWNWAGDYGTSEDSKEMFEYLKAYSPLHNLKPGTRYPATLVTTADHDDRVVPAHSFKFAATLQECNDGTNPTLIRIDSKAGHGAGKPMSKVLEEQADIYSFIMYNLGMTYNGK